MKTHNRKMSLDEVLDQLFYSSDAPDAQKMQEAVEAHPEYRQDILDFTVLWAAYKNSPDPIEEFRPSQVSDQSVSRLQSFVLNRLYEIDHEASKNTAVDLGAAKEALSNLAGNALRKAADAVGLYGSSALLQKVLNNGIRDVPRKVLADLATYLHVTMEALSGALLERGRGGVRSYKASDKPTVTQKETWSNAVNGLPLTDEQKRELLALHDAVKPL